MFFLDELKFRWLLNVNITIFMREREREKRDFIFDSLHFAMNFRFFAFDDPIINQINLDFEEQRKHWILSHREIRYILGF